MPAKIILDITQNTTFSRQFQCVDTLGVNVPTGTVDAGPHVFRFRDKDVDSGGQVKATGTATINTTGLVTLTMTNTETAKILDPTWPWEVRAVDGTTLWSVFQGTANLTKQIA